LTGKLQKYTRKEAMQVLEKIGGFSERGVTKKTRFLILGTQIKDGNSNKQLKAEKYSEKGQNIEIIPEVSVPGHSHIMGRIHPEILCNYTPDLSKSNGYDCRNAWCVAKEENYKLLDDIIHEIAELFPSKYIHLGGDEVNFKVWEPCPDCQALAKKLGIKVGPQLQDIFSERVRQIAKRYGKIPAIYDEAIDGGELSKETIVYAWRNIDWARKTSERGYPTIVMPGESFYFDTKQSNSEVGHHWSFAFDAKHIVEWEFEKLGFS
jgi:hexosaminidase